MNPRCVVFEIAAKSATLREPMILTRRPNETFCIGADVRITVLAVNGAQVRWGIEAPLSVAVDREELYQRKHAERSNRIIPPGS
jgi:carbon storage regulator